MRVCSKDRTHDLSETDPWNKVCPVCGYAIIEAEEKPEPAGTTETGSRDAGGDTLVFRRDEPPEDEKHQSHEPPDGTIPDEGELSETTPPRPEPFVICGKDPWHDIGGRAPDAQRCPKPGCDGMLIQLECRHDPEHDVSDCIQHEFRCPVCGNELVTPSCTHDHAHSMIGRVAGGTACPRCQYNVVRNPYHPPHRGTEHETEKVPWWRRVIAWWHSLPPWQRWSLIAAPLAVAIGVIAYGIIPSPDRVCAAVPKQPAQALAAVTTRIKAGINATDATALAQTHLQCGQPDAALLLLRTAFDKGDVTAAHILGRLFDPSGPPDAVGRQPPSAVRAIEWYGRAVKAGDATVRPDLQRLAGWLRAGASKGDNEAAGLADDAEAALKEDR